jgi:hypothetical protein
MPSQPVKPKRVTRRRRSRGAQHCYPPSVTNDRDPSQGLRTGEVVDIAQTEEEAIESGKQKFELAEFERMLKRGPQNEAERKRSYYVEHPEFQTMGEFAKYTQNVEPGQNRRLTPRSLAEMTFAASLVPCEHCGSTQHAMLDLQGAGNSWVLYGPCPSCDKARSMSFVTDGDPLGREHDALELGGAEPSRIITAEQFVTELERLLPATRTDPTTLDVTAWSDACTLNRRAAIVARELVKFPSHHRYRRERDRLDARAAQFNADAPRIWLMRRHHLTLGEEIRGLFNQITVVRLPTFAEIQAYLERRTSFVGLRVRVASGTVIAELDADSAVARIRAYEEEAVTTIALRPRSGTRSDIENTLGRTGAPPVIMGHRLGVAIEYDGDAVKLVTITFADRERVRRPADGAPVAVPETDDAPVRRTVTAETVVSALVEPPRPPATVGALLDALAIELDASTIALSTKGTVVIPRRCRDWLFTQEKPHIAIRCAEGPAHTALRDQRVLAFSLVCADKGPIEAALRRRFETSSVSSGARGDDYRTFGPWVYTARSCVLGWFEHVPDWLHSPCDTEARSRALRALLEGIPKTEGVKEVMNLVARLSPSSGVVLVGCDADAVEVSFCPPIPAKVLVRAFVLQSDVVRLEGEAWVLRRLPRPDEPGRAMPLTLGPWTILPRLREQPTQGTMEDEELHIVDALDVVVSMRIESAPASDPAKAPTEVEPPPELVAIMDAILAAPALPRTVREFERAFAVTITDAHLGACTEPGWLVIRTDLPPPLVAVGLQWIGEPHPRSVEALRDCALAGRWSLQLAEGRAYVRARLRTALGYPLDLGSRQEFTAAQSRFIVSGLGERGTCTLALLPYPDLDVAGLPGGEAGQAASTT